MISTSCIIKRSCCLAMYKSSSSHYFNHFHGRNLACVLETTPQVLREWILHRAGFKTANKMLANRAVFQCLSVKLSSSRTERVHVFMLTQFKMRLNVTAFLHRASFLLLHSLLLQWQSALSLSLGAFGNSLRARSAPFQLYGNSFFFFPQMYHSIFQSASEQRALDAPTEDTGRQCIRHYRWKQFKHKLPLGYHAGCVQIKGGGERTLPLQTHLMPQLAAFSA